MNRLSIVAAVIALLSGCTIYNNDRDDNYVEVIPNYIPEVYDGASGCYWDNVSYDDIWYFEAYVDDMDGLGDITEVWADVIDDRSGHIVESFELYPTEDPYVWFSDWMGSTTQLTCINRVYSVDLVAYDVLGDTDILNVLPLAE